jgi:FkbM family methyltransferase
MEAQIRQTARKYLPGRIRRPLGRAGGKFKEWFLEPLQGLLFDALGGRFRTQGCIFEIPRNLTTRTYRACFWKGDYEREERDLIERWIRPEDNVLEIGACLGIVSCVTNKLLSEKSRHVVVEANPLCLGPLKRNKELNGANFLIEHCAVGEAPEVTFYLHPVYIVGGTSQRPTDRPVQVPGKSIDQLEREHGRFTVLIIDVEGSEQEIFEQSRDVLQKYRLIVVELHEFAIGVKGVQRCREILRASGLQLVDRSGITEAWQRQ